MPDTVCRTTNLTERFKGFIEDAAYPCVGAKSALAHDQLSFVEAGDINCPKDDGAIHSALCDFTLRYQARPTLFQSLVVIFQSPRTLTEPDFEQALWARVQSLETIDAGFGYLYDPRVSADVQSPHFSLSFGGEAFFLIGLHPGASRPARRFETPALVFNPHDQFEQLRESDRYEGLHERIMARDIALAGTANPMLASHGDISEARQYSGRVVDERWTCPYSPVYRKENPK